MKRFISMILIILMIASCGGCSFFGDKNTEETTTVGDGVSTQAPDGSLSLNGNFRIRGKKTADLTEALAQVGVAVGDKTAASVIYIGDDGNDLSQAAKTKIRSRENYYNDYAILCNGTDIAIFGGSDAATDAAIAHFVMQYVKDGRIAIMPDTCDYVQVENKSVTIGGASLKGFCVVAQDSKYQSLAGSLAASLSGLTGYPVSGNGAKGEKNLTLIAESNMDKGDFAQEYTLTVTEDGMSLTAPSLASLSHALAHFIDSLSTKADFAVGTNEKREFTMTYADAANTELFKYCGMWEATDAANPGTMVSYWTTAYVEINFTGNAITVDFSDESTFRIKMDDASYSSPYTANGKMTFFAEGEGMHTLRICNNNDRHKHLYFAGASVAEGATLSRTPDRKLYVQFIGDSITHNMATKNKLSYVCDNLGFDFGVSAYAGIALEENFGNWHANNGYNKSTKTYTEGSMAKIIYDTYGITNIGMEDAFFKLGIPDEKMQGEERELYAANYFSSDFDCSYESGNMPDVIFTFLGTNDELFSYSNHARFTENYIKFVEKIIKTYGEDIKIVVMQAISNGSRDPKDEEASYYYCIGAAGRELAKRFPNNVTFLDSDVVLNWNVEINLPNNDTIHPTDSGYATLASSIGKTLEDLFVKKS